ncbi:Papain-like cysteine protease c1, partial [Globisporangium splendens]
MVSVSSVCLGLIAASTAFVAAVDAQSYTSLTEWKQSTYYTEACKKNFVPSAGLASSSSGSGSSSVGSGEFSMGTVKANATTSVDEDDEILSEEQKRFDQALADIQELQKLHPYAKFSVNTPFALMTHDEFLAYVNRNNANPDLEMSSNSTVPMTRSTEGISSTDGGPITVAIANSTSGSTDAGPKTSAAASGETVDWQQKGCVTAVRDQSECGACWAFSATAAMESGVCVETGGASLPSLADQELISCDNSGQSQGCGGGYASYTMDWIANSRAGKMCTLNTYPFASADGNVPACRMSSCTEVDIGVTGFQSLRKDPSAQEDIVRSRPVSVFLYSGSRAFQFYSGGILTGENCDKTGAHSGLAVGFGEENGMPYWRVKNQWGTQWGEAGYVRIQRRYSADSEGACGVELYASWPTFKSGVTAAPTAAAALLLLHCGSDCGSNCCSYCCTNCCPYCCSNYCSGCGFDCFANNVSSIDSNLRAIGSNSGSNCCANDYPRQCCANVGPNAWRRLPGIIAEGRKLRGTFCAEWLPYMTSTADGWLLDSNGSPYKLAHTSLSVGTAQLGDILRWEWIRPGVLNFIPTCGISGFSRPSIRALERLCATLVSNFPQLLYRPQQTNVLRLYNGQRHYNHEWHLHTSEATLTHVDTTLVKATHAVHSALDYDVMATRDLNGQKEKADLSCSNPECSQVVQSSVQHLFWECPKAKLVWNYFYALWAKIGITPGHDPAIWIFSLDLPDTPRHAWTTIKRHIIGHKFSNEHLQDHLYPVAHMLWRYMSASLIQTIWCAHLRRMDSDPIESTAEMAIMMTRLEAGMRNLTRLAEAQDGDSDGHTVAAVLKVYVDCFLSQTDALPLTPSDTRDVYLLFFDGGSRGNPGPGGTGSIIVRVHKDSHTASLIWTASMAYSRKDTTNNFAEHWGLIHGLREAQRSHFESLYVIGDSALITSQQRMHRSPRQHRLARLYQTSRRLADCIDIRGWYHHYRAFNKMADSAANLAMDTRTSTQVLWCFTDRTRRQTLKWGSWNSRVLATCILNARDQILKNESS